MSEIEEYYQIFKKIKQRARLNFVAKKTPKGLLIGEILFRPMPEIGKWTTYDYKTEGHLTTGAYKSGRVRDRKERFSYLSLTGEFYYAPDGILISLDESEDVARSMRHPRRKLTSLAQSSLPTPTLFISPNAFAILDQMFRLPDYELAKFRSALAFAKAFSLVQPKLNQMMRSLRVDNLLDFKASIRGLPSEWWLNSMRYPMTKKGLTPYFFVARPFKTLNTNTDSTAFLNLISLEKYNAVSGPPMIARDSGLLVTRDHHFWMPGEKTAKFKKDHKLVPGYGDTWTCWLATPEKSFAQEAIAGVSEDDNGLRLESNRFRAVWDLAYGDERMREIQINVLTRILNERK